MAMTSEERLQAVIRCEKPDRVPVAPMIYYFAAYYAGITVHELWSDWQKYEMAIQKCYNELGPWDIYYPICPTSPETYQASLLMKVKYPGVDLPADEICQFDEYEIMTPEDYDWIINYKGLDLMFLFEYRLHIMSKFMPGFKEDMRSRARLYYRLMENVIKWRFHFRWFRDRGVAMLLGTASEAPFDQFSMSRSMMPFTFDLTDRPEKVKAAAERLAPAFGRNQALSAKLMGVPRALVFVHRSGTDFISPRMFEEISLPSLKTICEILIEAGVTPVLHCDGNWDKNLKALRKLPPKKCIIQFDGPTNIFRAKQEIGDMHCLFGDVNAYDLVMGSPAQIDEYCHRLIEEVGRGGGFILAAGCEVPPNAKPENVKAMIEAPRKHEAPS